MVIEALRWNGIKRTKAMEREFNLLPVRFRCLTVCSDDDLEGSEIGPDSFDLGEPCRIAQPMMYAVCDEVHPFADVSLDAEAKAIERHAGTLPLKDRLTVVCKTLAPTGR